ncbi:hypothetical protein PHLGIDRAFT_352672 [Phlebiopsis gigantea 11061_1 CR5-6]|uniref:Uncharacterized protein n=1 Tax=Phlebiopsis gigantea (strain 11061_1 CR5-6) TaxID=745531 RepID=A0A0C3RPL7_PHLG1|nr:hypothetical protein PHLGIDRAFT_352672 [Phlebiopsis gigantea 11061_1 CR5-6]
MRGLVASSAEPGWHCTRRGQRADWGQLDTAQREAAACDHAIVPYDVAVAKPWGMIRMVTSARDRHVQCEASNSGVRCVGGRSSCAPVVGAVRQQKMGRDALESSSQASDEAPCAVRFPPTSFHSPYAFVQLTRTCHTLVRFQSNREECKQRRGYKALGDSRRGRGRRPSHQAPWEYPAAKPSPPPAELFPPRRHNAVAYRRPYRAGRVRSLGTARPRWENTTANLGIAGLAAIAAKTGRGRRTFEPVRHRRCEHPEGSL